MSNFNIAWAKRASWLANTFDPSACGLHPGRCWRVLKHNSHVSFARIWKNIFILPEMRKIFLVSIKFGAQVFRRASTQEIWSRSWISWHSWLSTRRRTKKTTTNWYIPLSRLVTPIGNVSEIFQRFDDNKIQHKLSLENVSGVESHLRESFTKFLS